MGASQRRKGANYELEVAREFSAAIGVPVKRNLDQVRDGGKDLQVGPLVIECKRRKQLSTWQGWLDQAKRACDRTADPREIPVVVMRPDLGRSMVLVGLEDFLDLAAPEVRRRLAAKAHAERGVLPPLPTDGADIDE